VTGFFVLLGSAAVALTLGALYVRVNGRFRAPAGPDDDAPTLTRADIGAPLGEQSTLVQFSSAFCSPCRATRLLLADVADRTPGISHVEIDAESHLDLVRRLGVVRTPTVFVLDATGRIKHRASGLPTRHQVDHVLHSL
jgi:thiol-disulfide isomerase/thioredoxin